MRNLAVALWDGKSMMRNVLDDELTWQLLHTKPRAEEWARANLARQGFAVVLPRVATANGIRPLFPRYLFAGFDIRLSPEPLKSTYGVSYVVHVGELPARVSPRVIRELVGRMDARGVVALDAETKGSIYSRTERDRVRALVKLASAGYRIKSA